ncbi:MAG: argininosuccinate lyase [Deltaproteobacteria bacterium]|nr:argininosuccinate lyase [Deltaproteobacteria bacterium]
MKKTGKKAWSGRFSRPSSSQLEAFNNSLPFDRRLYAEDIQGSKAHAKMLAKIGVLSAEDAKKIEKGLGEIQTEIEQGTYPFNPELEDIHMAIEARLTEKIGPAGAKLHTARSRNDQVATDMRLHCRKKLGETACLLAGLEGALVTLAEEKGLIPMPGYTHLQRAQPILWAHHLLAYFEMFERDKERLLQISKRTNVSPLGSGALAGSTFPIARELTAKELGFDSVSANSLDAVSDRDFVAEFIFALSLIMVHLSRFSEELILWSSQEFGFVALPQEFCTGSSMMPQKMNPDVPELVRGKTGRVFGHLMGILTVLKGLPLAYNKDLQEDKEGLFDALDTVFACVKILTEMVPHLNPNAEKMAQAAEEGFLLATDVADYLAGKGLPFREAHEVSGKLVRDCIEKGTVLEKLSLSELKKYSDLFGEDVKSWLSVEASINRRKSVGGTARSEVKNQISRAKKILKI